ncbi:CPBP family intramembrane glutamic endopeptidase [Pseudonocardia sp. ICBG601]|uniref:CPBP family glutamic-type intramembrane protease n=1 Tax=Pseudonocardia sp. ICBG601 TaxID=2846759 RepID=UPI001CF6987A|nr:CPBP family intramembrane glutamic endopeptidase [Pseudonocardia sp. ICBG601]
MTSTFLVDYPLRLLPGLIVVGATFVLIGRSSPLLRIVLLVTGFVLVRDAMTPLGLWSIGPAPHGLLWLRLSPDPVVLLGMGTVGVAASLAVAYGPRDLRGLVVWGRLGPRSLLAALGGAAVLLVPLTAVLWTVPVEQRGGAVAVGLLPALAVLAFGGNLLEEVLFRGLLQGHLAGPRAFGAVRAVVASGLLFAVGHVVLATTVTDLGWPILVFTAAEGLVCAWVRHGHGVLAATLTHGTVILGLASGL